MPSWSRIALLGLVIATVVASPGIAMAQWTLYDDFSSPLINPDKWFGTNVTGGADNPTLEEARLIRFGFLQLMLRQYGRDDTDSGTSSGSIRLQIVDPAAVKGMQARVIVLRAETDSCATNPSTAVRGRAQLNGALFNDGSSTGPGDRTGDVFAGTQQILDTVLGAAFNAFLLRCSNPSCSSFTAVDPDAPPTFATTWTPGRLGIFTLSFLWDKPNKKVIYSVKALAGNPEVIEIAYTLADSQAPGLDYKLLQVSNGAPNCNGSRKHVLMDAFFDQVMVQ